MKCPYPLAGFGLIEVLIAFAIASVALMGAARLMIITQQTASDDFLRTQAYFLAQDMVGRIKANSANARACTLSDYHTMGVNGATQQADNTACFGGVSVGKWYSCTPIEVAQQDMRDWKNLVAGTTDASSPGTITQGLPGGVGVVCCTNNVNYGDPNNYGCDTATAPSQAQYAVKVHWKGRDGSMHRIVASVVP